MMLQTASVAQKLCEALDKALHNEFSHLDKAGET